MSKVSAIWGIGPRVSVSSVKNKGCLEVTSVPQDKSIISETVLWDVTGLEMGNKISSNIPPCVIYFPLRHSQCILANRDS